MLITQEDIARSNEILEAEIKKATNIDAVLINCDIYQSGGDPNIQGDFSFIAQKIIQATYALNENRNPKISERKIYLVNGKITPLPEITDQQIDSVLSTLYNKRESGESIIVLLVNLGIATTGNAHEVLKGKITKEARVADENQGRLVINEKGKRIYLGYGSYSKYLEHTKKEEIEKTVQAELAATQLSYYKDQQAFIKAQIDLSHSTRKALSISYITLIAILIYTIATIVTTVATCNSLNTNPTNQNLKDIEKAIKDHK